MLVGVALLVATLWFVGPARIAGALAGVSPLGFVLALVLSIASNAASAWRWATLARAIALTAPTLRLLPMYARGITSNSLLPGATLSGDALRSFELARLGNPLVESAASVALDRFSGLWTLCVLSFLAAGLAWSAGLGLDVAGGRPILLSYGALMGMIVVLPFVPWPLHLLERIPLPGARRMAALWQRLRTPAGGMRMGIGHALGLSVAVQVLSSLALLACAHALGARVPALMMFAAAAPIFVMGALPIGVAGFGTRELAAVAVLGLAGVPADQAAATGLLYGVLGVTQGVLAAPLFLWRR